MARVGRLPDRVKLAKRRVLVIEDEESISEPLAEALEREGFAAEVAATASHGIELWRTRAPDLVLLDVMLPDGDGREVLREIRASSRVPVVMVTARGEEMDRVVGLELGADDYVTKPFSAKELVARIRAVLRRTGESIPTTRSATLGLGDVVMDLDTRTVTKDLRLLDLTLKEFELLRMLAGASPAVKKWVPDPPQQGLHGEVKSEGSAFEASPAPRGTELPRPSDGCVISWCRE